ncbi:MAG: hypothetical protein RLY61_961 [Candidatus Parcubacteria bacterium]|jgi:hypothetical protein
MTEFDPKLPPEPTEQGPDLKGSTADSGADGAQVRSGAHVGADGDLPDQTGDSARPDLTPSDN